MALALDATSLNAIAANSAVASRAWVHEKLGRSDVEVSCVCPLLCSCVACDCVSFAYCSAKCLHYARYSGPVEAGSHVTQKTMLKFTWQLVAGEDRQSCEVHLLCRDAARRGVRPPKQWKSELNLGLGLQALDDLAVAAIQRVRDEFALPDSVKLDCMPRFTHALARICGRGQLACVQCWHVCLCAHGFARACQTRWTSRCFHSD